MGGAQKGTLKGCIGMQVAFLEKIGNSLGTSHVESNESYSNE